MVTYDEYYKFVLMGLESLKGKIDESIDFTNQQVANLAAVNTTQDNSAQEKSTSTAKATPKPKTK